MHVIAAETIRAFSDKNADARKPLGHWLDIVEKAVWTNVNDVLSSFPKTDCVKVDSGKHVHIFNIKGDTYRLITAIHFNRGKVYILMFMTHAEYSKNSWKGKL